MRRNEIVFDGLFDVWHVAGNTVAGGTVCCVVSVILNGALQTCGIVLVVTPEAEFISFFNQI